MEVRNNVIIDGNFLFNRSFGVFAGFKNQNPGESLKEPSDKAAFMKKIMEDFCHAVNSLPLNGRVIFVSDSRSWRKDVPIEGGGYKSSRKKEEGVDWTPFYELIVSFGEYLESKGFLFSKVKMAEGDDLLWAWSDYFLREGENCVIITGDRDMNQLAEERGENWTVVWDPKSKKSLLFCPPGWANQSPKETHKVSIFEMDSLLFSEDRGFSKVMENSEVNEIYSRKFVIEKILVGDNGDDVPSVWREKRSDGKFNNVTPAKASKIYEAIEQSKWSNTEIKDLLLDKEFIYWVSSLAIKSIKGTDSSENRSKAAKNLIRNFKLMWLNEMVIPEDLLSLIEDEIKSKKGEGKKFQRIDKDSLISESPWGSQENSIPSAFDPFKFI